jgi:type II secretion system protein N
MLFRLKTKYRRPLILTGYCLYGLLAVLFFVYLTLPVDAIGRFFLAKISAQAGVLISAKSFKRSAPFGFDTAEITVTDLSGSQLFLKSPRLSIAVVPSSLLSNRRLVKFRMPLYGGSAEGRLSIDSSRSVPRYELDAAFQNIVLEETPLLPQKRPAQPDRQAGGRPGDAGSSSRQAVNVHGIGRMEVHYVWDANRPTTGSGRILTEVRDLKTERMTVMNFPVADLSFSKALGKLTIKDGIATLNEFSGSGSGMDITASGLVQLRNPLSASLLNMTMKLALNNKSGLPDSLVLLKSLVGENRPIEIEITGTMDRPFINTRGLSLQPNSRVSLGPPPLASPAPPSLPGRQAEPDMEGQ